MLFILQVKVVEYLVLVKLLPWVPGEVLLPTVNEPHWYKYGAVDAPSVMMLEIFPPAFAALLCACVIAPETASVTAAPVMVKVMARLLLSPKVRVAKANVC